MDLLLWLWIAVYSIEERAAAARQIDRL